MNKPLTSGELFAGYGGLALAVEHALGATTQWVSEIEDAPTRILNKHFPNTPNYGDVTTIGWETMPPVNIISGGSPCQDVSLAGARKGMTEGTRSNLWVTMREAITIIQPQLVVWENVKGAKSARATSNMEPCPGCVGENGGGEPQLRALGRVLGDLASLGYDAQWCSLRASDVGAPHRRERIFVLAHRRDAYTYRNRRDEGREKPVQTNQISSTVTGLGERGCCGCTTHQERNPETLTEPLFPTPVCSDYHTAPSPEAYAQRLQARGRKTAGKLSEDIPYLMPTPNTMDNLNWREGEARVRALKRGVDTRKPSKRTGNLREEVHFNFHEYEPAIRRWENILGRVAPSPTQPSKTGRPQLNPEFSEWMMGLPAGWVTDPALGLSRAQQLKAIGNGVVPQQAAVALAYMMGNLEEI